MPTYVYRCEKCESRFERFQSMQDPPVSSCPDCQQHHVVRVPSVGGLLTGRAVAPTPCGTECDNGSCAMPSSCPAMDNGDW